MDKETGELPFNTWSSAEGSDDRVLQHFENCDRVLTVILNASVIETH